MYAMNTQSESPTSQATQHMRGRAITQRWPLLALIVFILFPLEWLGLLWPAFGRVLGGIFATEVQHALGHMGLFFLLGLLALLFFPSLRMRPLWYMALILIGIGQEGFQLLTIKHRAPALVDVRDVGIDLGGLLLAFLLVWLWNTIYTRTGSVPQKE